MRLLEILNISRDLRVITNGTESFAKGVLLQKNIFYKGESISAYYAKSFINKMFRRGNQVEFEIINKVGDTALLSFDVSSHRSKKLIESEQELSHIEEGKRYEVEIVNDGITLPNYYVVKISRTKIRGIVLREQITGELNENNALELTLFKKASSPLRLCIFINEISNSNSLEDNENSPSVFSEEELLGFSDEERNEVERLLETYHIQKKEEIIRLDGVNLFCRVPSKYAGLLMHFRESNLYDENPYKTGAYWVSFYEDTRDDTEHIVLLKSTPCIIIKLKRSRGCFEVEHYDSTRTHAESLSYIRRNNPKVKLLIPSSRVQFVDEYGYIRFDYDTDTIIDAIKGRLFLYDKYSTKDSFQSQRNDASTLNYLISNKYLRYKKEKEIENPDQIIEIPADCLSVKSNKEVFNGQSSLLLDVDSEEIMSVIGNFQERDDNIHVIVMNGDEDIASGILSVYEGKWYFNQEGLGNDYDVYKRNGLKLRRKNNTRHFDIQIKALEEFVKEDSLGVYKDLLDGKLQPPENINDDDINFKNPNFTNKHSDQAKAVRRAIGNQNILLIQGPPGTGKTTVIVEIIQQLLQRNKKILVCSQAHSAVDNIYNKLPNEIQKSKKTLYLGESEEDCVNRETYITYLRNTLEFICGDKRLEDIINTEGKGFQELHKYLFDNLPVIENLGRDEIGELVRNYYSDAEKLTQDFLEVQKYDSYQLILGTCVGVGMNRVLSKEYIKFDTVIVDEAGKANLSETIIPLRLGKRFILVGDHHQLPPYLDREEVDDFFKSIHCSKDEILSQLNVESFYSAISSSLFEDFFDKVPKNNKVMLHRQYRMNPEIGEFISQLFYGRKLVNDTSTEIQVLEMDEFSNAVTFVDTSNNGDKAYEKVQDTSRINTIEAQYICNQILKEVEKVKESDKSLTVGIITPYKAQRALLQKMLVDKIFENDVYTIDSIQGSEFDIVIFSFVRAFKVLDGGNRTVGFLDDLRRLNVSLSRAKKKLILVGNLSTLCNPLAHDGYLSMGHTSTSPIDVFKKIAKYSVSFTDNSDEVKFYKAKPLVGTTYHAKIIKKAQRKDPKQKDWRHYWSFQQGGQNLTFPIKWEYEGLLKDGEEYEIRYIGQDHSDCPIFQPYVECEATLLNVERNSNNLVLSYSNETAPLLEVGTIFGNGILDGQFIKSLLESKSLSIGNTIKVWLQGNIKVKTISEKSRTLKFGEAIKVWLQENEENNTILVSAANDDAKRCLEAYNGYYNFTATPIGTNDNNQLKLRFPDGTHASINGEYAIPFIELNQEYSFVKLPNWLKVPQAGHIVLNGMYYDAFIKVHNTSSKYLGTISKHINHLYYVNVDDFICILKDEFNDNLPIGTKISVWVKKFAKREKLVILKSAEIQ